MADDTAQSKPLPPKWDQFAIFVVSGLNPSDAYRKAYKPKRAKAKTIHEASSRLMRRVKVRARIEELKRPVIERAQMSREEWLERLTRTCLADPRKMFDDHGNPLEIVELGDNEAFAIAGFEFCEEFSGKGESRLRVGFTKKFKQVDPLRALELLGKAQCFYVEKREITGADGKPISLTVEFIEPEVVTE